MVERVVRIHEVRGSIPLISTYGFWEYLLGYSLFSYHIIHNDKPKFTEVDYG